MASSARVSLTPLRRCDDGVVARWRVLAEAAVDPNPFAHPDFTLPAALTLPEGADALLLHVDRGDDMTFALPVLRTRRYRKLRIATLASWRHQYNFLGTPLASTAEPTEDWLAAIAHVRRNIDVDLLAFELLPADRPGLACLAEAAGDTGLRVSTFDHQHRPVIHRRPDPDYLTGGMSSKRRKNLRRQRRHLDERLGGNLERIDWAPHDEARGAAADLFLGLEASGWKGRAGTAMACDPTHAAFFRVMVDSFGSNGRLQLWFLEAAGTPVAGQCNLIAGDTVFHFKVAYDESLGEFSPGVLLELEMVEEFHTDHRLQRIDSCAAPGSMYESLYPDSRALCAAMVPLHGSARVLAPALATALRRRAERAARKTTTGPGGEAA